MSSLLRLLAALLLLGSCGEAGFDSAPAMGGDTYEDPDGGYDPGAGVGQDGVQDLGGFRRTIEAGGVPPASSLDAGGFLAEHKFELPPPACGQDICLHALVGQMGNMITGSECTTVLLGLNTPIDPSKLERPPLDLAIAVDVSGSMEGEKIEFVRDGLLAMLQHLDPADRLTLVTYEQDTHVLVRDRGADDAELADAIRGLAAGGMTNLHGGLTLAFAEIVEGMESTRQNRVILLSDGVPTAGEQSPDAIVRVADAHSARGVALTTIGVGRDFDFELMRRLAETGGGNAYFLEDPEAVQEVFTEEIQTFVVPIAEDARITYDGGPAWGLREIFGVRDFTLSRRSATLQMPSLFIAHRRSSTDTGKGRRGGGGGILLEILPAPEPVATTRTIGTLELSYRAPGTEDRLEQRIDLAAPFPARGAPREGAFTHPTVEKAFVALNVFTGLRMAVESCEAGDCGPGLAVLRPLRGQVAAWLGENPDPDIEADLALIDGLMRNLVARGADRREPPEPEDPWPND